MLICTILWQINDKYYPWAIRKEGEGTGLKFTVRYNKSFQDAAAEAKFGLHVSINSTN